MHPEAFSEMFSRISDKKHIFLQQNEIISKYKSITASSEYENSPVDEFSSKNFEDFDAPFSYYLSKEAEKSVKNEEFLEVFSQPDKHIDESERNKKKIDRKLTKIDLLIEFLKNEISAFDNHEISIIESDERKAELKEKLKKEKLKSMFDKIFCLFGVQNQENQFLDKKNRFFGCFKTQTFKIRWKIRLQKKSNVLTKIALMTNNAQQNLPNTVNANNNPQQANTQIPSLKFFGKEFPKNATIGQICRKGLANTLNFFPVLLNFTDELVSKHPFLEEFLSAEDEDNDEEGKDKGKEKAKEEGGNVEDQPLKKFRKQLSMKLREDLKKLLTNKENWKKKEKLEENLKKILIEQTKNRRELEDLETDQAKLTNSSSSTSTQVPENNEDDDKFEEEIEKDVFEEIFGSGKKSKEVADYYKTINRRIKSKDMIVVEGYAKISPEILISDSNFDLGNPIFVDVTSLMFLEDYEYETKYDYSTCDIEKSTYDGLDTKFLAKNQQILQNISNKAEFQSIFEETNKKNQKLQMKPYPLNSGVGFEHTMLDYGVVVKLFCDFRQFDEISNTLRVASISLPFLNSQFAQNSGLLEISVPNYRMRMKTITTDSGTTVQIFEEIIDDENSEEEVEDRGKNFASEKKIFSSLKPNDKLFLKVRLDFDFENRCSLVELEKIETSFFSVWLVGSLLAATAYLSKQYFTDNIMKQIVDFQHFLSHDFMSKKNTPKGTGFFRRFWNFSKDTFKFCKAFGKLGLHVNFFIFAIRTQFSNYRYLKNEIKSRTATFMIGRQVLKQRLKEHQEQSKQQRNFQF